METSRSREQIFQTGLRNTSLFAILIFALGIAAVSLTIHRAYGVDETATPKSVSQPVPKTEPAPQPKPAQGLGEGITKSSQQKPMSPLKTTLFILTTMFNGFTYPMICAIYFKTLIRRRNEIIGLLEGIAMDRHLKLFGTFSPKDLFKLYHNWKDYMLPVALNMIVVWFVSASVIAQKSGLLMPAPFSLFANLPFVVIVGFVGAYIFSHYDMLRRISTMDLTPSIMYKLWLKLLIGGVLGYLVASLIKPPEFQFITAFGIGIFPFDKLRDFIGGVASKSLNLSPEGVLADQPNLHKLQGLTADVIDRLQEEGITTTQHLALANPLLILLKISIGWRAILDMINQAVLYVFIGDKIEQLRAIGIRSATEIVNIRRLVNNDDEEKRNNGKKLIELIAAKISQDTVGTINLIETVADNFQVKFICDLERECEGKEDSRKP
jgi:hypothetical protein